MIYLFDRRSVIQCNSDSECSRLLIPGNLVNVIIPRPSYNGEDVPGLGMVNSHVQMF